MMKTNSTHWLIFGFAILLYAIACVCPAITTITLEGRFAPPYYGWQALFTGFLTIGYGTIFWLPNPLMLVVGVLMLFKKAVPALTVATFAVGCSLTIFIWTGSPINDQHGNVLLFGSWFWFASIACVWFSSFIAWRNTPKVNEPNRVESDSRRPSLN